MPNLDGAFYQAALAGNLPAEPGEYSLAVDHHSTTDNRAVKSVLLS